MPLGSRSTHATGTTGSGGDSQPNESVDKRMAVNPPAVKSSAPIPRSPSAKRQNPQINPINQRYSTEQNMYRDTPPGYVGASSFPSRPEISIPRANVVASSPGIYQPPFASTVQTYLTYSGMTGFPQPNISVPSQFHSPPQYSLSAQTPISSPHYTPSSYTSTPPTSAQQKHTQSEHNSSSLQSAASPQHTSSLPRRLNRTSPQSSSQTFSNGVASVADAINRAGPLNGEPPSLAKKRKISPAGHKASPSEATSSWRSESSSAPRASSASSIRNPSPPNRSSVKQEPSVEKKSRVKRERSPSPVLSDSPHATTEGTLRIAPVPADCVTTAPGFQANRRLRAWKEMQKLQKLGVEPSRIFFREDGMVIDWKSSVPVMSDTLLPARSDDRTISPPKLTPSKASKPSTRSGGLSRIKPTSKGKERMVPSVEIIHDDIVLAKVPPSKLHPLTETVTPPVVERPQTTMNARKGPPIPRGLLSKSPFTSSDLTPAPEPPPPPLPETSPVNDFLPDSPPYFEAPAESTGRAVSMVPDSPSSLQISEAIERSRDCDAAHLLQVSPATETALDTSPLSDVADLERAALAYLVKYVRTFDTDRAALAQAYSCSATITVRTSPQGASSLQQGRTAILTALLALPTQLCFCARGDAAIKYDVAALGNTTGVLLVCYAQSVRTEEEWACDQAFVLKRKEWDEEDRVTEGLWPLVAVSHHIALRSAITN